MEYLAHFSIPISCPVARCVRTAWGRAVIIPATVAISTCLLGLINPDRHHTWCVNDDPLGFAVVFHTPLFFPLFLADLFGFEFLWSYTLLFYLVLLYFVFSWIFIYLFSVLSFSGVFLLPFHFWARCVSVSSYSFRLV